ncbi:MAG: S8 family serine peptidase [Leptospiraceae bacterium]|nr:S8 family serine peptidase [Leptospiraceae bacterium]
MSHKSKNDPRGILHFLVQIKYRNVAIICIFICFFLINNCETKKKDYQTEGFILFALAGSQPRSSNCNYSDFTADSGDDPLLSSEWHLSNGGEDLNIGTVWDTNRGDGIQVAVVDDGLDIYHEDLSINSLSLGSYNFGTEYFGFSQSLYDPYSVYAAHGTAVGGVIAARDKNGKGVSGIAPRACLAGYNVLIELTDANENTAMSYRAPEISVSNNSWGATDGTGKTASSSFLWRNGVNTGLSAGRGGKGTVYVWAAGNGANTSNAATFGGLETDNANQDGQANYYGVMAVCGIMDDGKRVSYSEKGANLWVCGYSQKTSFNSTLDGILTTDISNVYGYNPLPSSFTNAGYTQSMQLNNFNYSKIFNGTSGATPMVSAASALIIKENPKLGWRDVKLILAESAKKNDPLDSDWHTNGGSKITNSGTSYNINHKYGFGVIDISQAVSLAKTWTNVGTLLTYDTGTITTNATFSNNTILTGGASVTQSISSGNTVITKIEFIEVTITTTSADASDLEVVLTSPSGTKSTLAEAHICASGNNTNPINSAQTGVCGNYSGWVFGTARHLGETASGTWTLQIADRRIGTNDSTGRGNGGTLSSWRMKFYGREN